MVYRVCIKKKKSVNRKRERNGKPNVGGRSLVKGNVHFRTSRKVSRKVEEKEHENRLFTGKGSRLARESVGVELYVCIGNIAKEGPERYQEGIN